MPQPYVSYFHNNSSINTQSQKEYNKKRKNLQGEKAGVLLFVNNVHIIMYNTSISYLNGLRLFSFNKCLCIMFKVLMLSKITIILTTFVNSTDNVHVDDLAYYFFSFFLKRQYILP